MAILDKKFFKRFSIELEKSDDIIPESKPEAPSVPNEMWLSCNECKNLILKSDLIENDYVCNRCGCYFRLSARKRIAIIADKGSFEELEAGRTSNNILNFPDYTKKLKLAREGSGENESVICGTCKIGGFTCGIFAMEASFMMGSMGAVTGNKISHLFEVCTQRRLPVIGFTISGGARMQEGALSLMQMAYTSAAVKNHSDAGLLYTVVLTDPTTGGVTASFAMQADIILAEPGALIAFAGPRLIEQTINQKLPEGFQRAEFLLQKGFIDDIVERKILKKYLTNILRIHL